MTERPRSPELNWRDVRAFAQTFIPRWDGYPIQLADGSYIQVKNPLTIGAYALDAQWDKLIRLAQTLGSIFILGESNISLVFQNLVVTQSHPNNQQTTSLNYDRSYEAFPTFSH